MTKRTIDMIIRIGIEVVEWVSIILKEKRRETKQNDGKGNSKKKQKSRTTPGNPS
jgi:hypothetical protein